MLSTPALAAPPTQWFESTGGPSRGAVVVLHGLNLNPERMREWMDRYRARGHRALLVRLQGHREPSPGARECAFALVTADGWLNEARQAVAQARAWAEPHGLPIHVVGFSLGGLLASLLEAESGPVFASRLYLAPALRVSRVSRLFRRVTPWLPEFWLPARGPETYRANLRGSPIGAFRAMFELLARYEALGSPLLTPARILVDPGDELVNARGLEALARERGAGFVPLPVAPEASAISRQLGVIRHLIVDQASVGTDGWTEAERQALIP